VGTSGSDGGRRAGILVFLVVVSLLTSASVSLAASGASTVTPERWIRSVCRDTSTWLDAREAARKRVETVTADLAAGDQTAKAAAKRLTQAHAQAAKATGKLIDEVKAVGTPKLDGGKGVTKQYQGRLAEYQNAYTRAGHDLAGEPTKDDAEFAAAAQEIHATLTADLTEIGGDPLEDLRAVEELATGIAASCGDVDVYLGATVDTAGCTAALATAREYAGLIVQANAAPVGSPEESALFTQIDALIPRWRTELGGCNNAAVLGPCKPTLDTAQALVTAEATFLAAPVDSPEEQAALDELNRLDGQISTQVPSCPAS